VVDFLPKIKLEIAVEDSQLDATIDIVKTAANSDSIGDGKIFISELIDVVRIRTGETGKDAL
jgi:nitrogen regulatory protein PII